MLGFVENVGGIIFVSLFKLKNPSDKGVAPYGEGRFIKHKHSKANPMPPER